MKIRMKEIFLMLWREYFDDAELPIAFYYTDEEKVAENAEKLWQAAMEFYERTSKFQDKLSRMGKGLNVAVDAFNEAVGSFERRILPAGRKPEEFGIVKDTGKVSGQV